MQVITDYKRIIHDTIISPGIRLKFSIEDYILIVNLDANYFFFTVT